MDGLNLLIFMAGLGAALPIVAAIFLFLLLREKRLRAQSTLREARLAAQLVFAPDGYFRWDEDGESVSRRLAVLLDLPDGASSRFADLAERFSPPDGQNLEETVSLLRHEGRSFEMALKLRDSPRHVQILGQQLLDEKNRWLADILWVRDVTEDTTATAGLARELSDVESDRDRLRALINSLPMPAWVRGEEGRLVWCNRAYAAAVDAISPAAAMADGRELHPDGRELASEAKRDNLPRSASRHLAIDGVRRLFSIVEAPLADGGLGFALDETRTEEARSELARHVAAHAELLENLATALAIFGGDTRLVFHNAAFRKLWRLEREWLSAQPTYGEVLEALRERRLLPEHADFPAFKAEETRLFTSLISPKIDLLHLPDGSTLRRVQSPHPFGGLLFTYEDVTDTLALERSYNTLIAVQRETIDKLQEGVAVLGGDGVLKLSNPVFRRIWGLSEEDVADAPHFRELLELQKSYFAEKDWLTVRSGLEKMLASAQANSGRLERIDGMVLDYAGVPLPDGGTLIAWLDVTDTAQVERALIERNEALETANRLKSEFIANISHEVRAPLDTLTSFAEILSNEYFGALNERQMEYAKGVLDAAQSLQTLIADIIDLATIEAGQMALELDSFDIHSLLTGVLALTRERVRKKSLTLNFECLPDIGWMVADERRIKQVLFNLVSNAVRFTPPGGMITFLARREEDHVIFMVADTGVGIPQADLARIMAGQPLPESRHAGAGLGLSLVKSFIELHGGNVEISSAPNEGTTVTCTLPAGGG